MKTFRSIKLITGVASIAMAVSIGSAAAPVSADAKACVKARVAKASYDGRLIGTNSHDCLRGGRRDDRIDGRRGGDLLVGAGGADRIDAVDGAVDVVNCGMGRDTVIGDENDQLQGCEIVRIPGGHPPSGHGDDSDTPDAEDTPNSADCTVDPATLISSGCEEIKTDDSTMEDPEQLWGSLSCASADRVGQFSNGGDHHTSALGLVPNESAYRRLTVFDGDDYFGERCELGKNESRYGTRSSRGTFMTYQEGDHRITFLSVQIPESLQMNTEDWQTIAQMKQAQPSANGGGSPIIELQLRNGEYVLDSPTGSYFSTPATPNTWARIALDVTYSKDPNVGSVQMLVDANGDGDAGDPGEVSPVVHTATLKEEIAGGEPDGIDPGASIPSHLRAGVYHNPSIPCGGGCSIDLDNVEVVG